MKKKQFAVLGLGSFGYSVAVSLQRLGCDVIAVDHSIDIVNEIADSVSYALQADVGGSEVFRAIGANNLDGIIITAVDDMEASIMATLTAKEVGIPFILAKARNVKHAQILRKVGADSVVFPEREMGERIARNLASARMMDWIALSPDFSILEREVPPSWVGKSLIELDVRKKYGINVVGIMDGDDVDLNPDPEALLEEGKTMLLVGANGALEDL